MEQLKKRAERLKEEIEQSVQRIGLAQHEAELVKLRAEMAGDDFWQDNQHAQQVSKQEANLVSKVKPWKQLQTEVDDLLELVKLGDAKMEKELH